MYHYLQAYPNEDALTRYDKFVSFRRCSIEDVVSQSRNILKWMEGKGTSYQEFLCIL